MRSARWTAAAAAVLTLGACSPRPTVGPPQPMRAGAATAPTPDSLAALFLNAFVGNSLAAFDSVDPDSVSRAVMHAAVQRKMAREANTRRVIWRNDQRAVLLLTGTVKGATAATKPTSCAISRDTTKRSRGRPVGTSRGKCRSIRSTTCTAR